MNDTTRQIESTSDALVVAVAELVRRGGLRFALVPDAPARARLAQALGAETLRKVRLVGEIVASGRHDWALRADLGATAVQACVVTAEPVTTRVEGVVERLYVRDLPEPTEAEAEIPEDDRLEPLGTTIDLGALLIEALALELPDYPRAPGASLPSDAPDEAPEASRPNPFAALAAQKKAADPD